jgi:hypothetical protein
MKLSILPGSCWQATRRMSIAILLVLLPLCAPAQAATPTGAELPGSDPEKVTFGVYVQDIYAFNFADGSVRISGYLWWKFRSDEFDPLESAGIINARDMRLTQPVRRTMPDGQHYVGASFFATINQRLDAAAYPFDSHRLTLILEHWYSSRELQLIADAGESRLSNELFSPGWHISDLAVSIGDYTYPTKFGSAAPSDQTYSRAQIAVSANRNSTGLVFDAFVGFFVSSLLCLGSYFVNPSMFGVRSTLIASATFAAISNKYLINSQIDAAVRSALADRVALAAFLMIGALLITSIICERLLEAGQVARAARFNRLAFIGVAIAYAVGISLSFALALYS